MLIMAFLASGSSLLFIYSVPLSVRKSMDRNTPSSSLSLTEVNPRSVAPASFKIDVQNTPLKVLMSGKGALSQTILPHSFPCEEGNILIRY